MRSNENNFINGIFALVVSQVFIKILGMLYTVYLTNKEGFGDKGNAIYMGGYQIYVMLLALSSIGIPNAISKLISEKIALNDYKGADRIFKISLVFFGMIGFLFTFLLYFFSDFISIYLLQIPESADSLKALSPAIFFVTTLSVIRGYCNGKNKINITANSQTIEQFFKCVLIIFFVSLVKNNDATKMASVANFATSIATLFTFLYVLIKIQKERKDKIFEINRKYFKKERKLHIMKRIFKISVPLSMSSLLSTANKNIDSITVVRILKNILGEEEAKIRYGMLTSKIDMFISIPMSFNVAFYTALIPELSSSLVKNDFENINKKLKLSFKMAILIGVPYMFGVFVYARQIIQLIFPNSSTGVFALKLSSIMIIFCMLTQTVNGALQGIGKNKAPLISLIYGTIFKFFANIILIRINGIYENGAVVGNILGNVVSFIIVYISLKKSIKLDFSIIKLFVKPVICSIAMICISYVFYLRLKIFGFNEYICSIIGIIVAVFSYIILIFISKYVLKEELFENKNKISKMA